MNSSNDVQMGAFCIFRFQLPVIMRYCPLPLLPNLQICYSKLLIICNNVLTLTVQSASKIRIGYENNKMDYRCGGGCNAAGRL